MVALSAVAALITIVAFLSGKSDIYEVYESFNGREAVEVYDNPNALVDSVNQDDDLRTNDHADQPPQYGDDILCFKAGPEGGFSSQSRYSIREQSWGHLNSRNEFVSSTNKNLISFPRREFGSPSYEDIDIIKCDDKFGYVDKQGKVIVNPKYDNAYGFRQGLAAVKKDGKWGYIDKSGEVVVPFRYDEADAFSEGLACVKESGGRGIGFIDKEGQIAIPFGKYFRCNAFSEGLVHTTNSPTSRLGFIDRNGSVVLPFKYWDVRNGFNNGRAVVRESRSGWFYINRDGTRLGRF